MLFGNKILYFTGVQIWISTLRDQKAYYSGHTDTIDIFTLYSNTFIKYTIYIFLYFLYFWVLSFNVTTDLRKDGRIEWQSGS